jgi:hypothetical protein
VRACEESIFNARATFLHLRPQHTEVNMGRATRLSGTRGWILLALLGTQAAAGPVYLDTSGREWLDPNATRFRSWNDTSLVCDATGGNCTGVLATHTTFSTDIDVSGYQWATRDEVRDLFYEIGGLPSGSLDSFSASFAIGAGHGTNAFEVFDPTIQLPVGPGVENILHGLTRDTYLDVNLLQRGYNGIIDNPPFGSDSFTLNGGLPVETREMSMGVFLYRPGPLAVPEPGTLVLLAGGLLGLLWAFRGGSRREGSPVAC